jgi:hypothetical protein
MSQATNANPTLNDSDPDQATEVSTPHDISTAPTAAEASRNDAGVRPPLHGSKAMRTAGRVLRAIHQDGVACSKQIQFTLGLHDPYGRNQVGKALRTLETGGMIKRVDTSRAPSGAVHDRRSRYYAATKGGAVADAGTDLNGENRALELQLLNDATGQTDAFLPTSPAEAALRAQVHHMAQLNDALAVQDGRRCAAHADELTAAQILIDTAQRTATETTATASAVTIDVIGGAYAATIAQQDDTAEQRAAIQTILVVNEGLTTANHALHGRVLELEQLAAGTGPPPYKRRRTGTPDDMITWPTAADLNLELGWDPELDAELDADHIWTGWHTELDDVLDEDHSWLHGLFTASPTPSDRSSPSSPPPQRHDDAKPGECADW